MKGIVAVDIGGTKVSAACFDGKLRAGQQIETQPSRGAERVTEAIVSLIANTARAGGLKEIAAVGVACPGPLMPSTGVVVHAPTLGWTDYPLRERLTRALGCPVLLENDANAAAYGEYRYGAGQGCGDMAYVTLSTGVGCGLILNGRIMYGKHEGAGELGHLNMREDGEPCVCGRRGCLEAYASGTGIAAIAKREALARGASAEHADALNAETVARRAREGDAMCQGIYRQAGFYLGKAFAALQMITDVGRIIVGGSVAAQLDLLLPTLGEAAAAYSYWGDNAQQWLLPAALGPHAGLIGAGALAMALCRA